MFIWQDLRNVSAQTSTDYCSYFYLKLTQVFIQTWRSTVWFIRVCKIDKKPSPLWAFKPVHRTLLHSLVKVGILHCYSASPFCHSSDSAMLPCCIKPHTRATLSHLHVVLRKQAKAAHSREFLTPILHDLCVTFCNYTTKALGGKQRCVILTSEVGSQNWERSGQ